MPAPLPPGVSREQVEKLLYDINLCQYGERETRRGHYDYDSGQYVNGLNVFTRDALKGEGLPISDNPDTYKQCIAEQRQKLVELNPLESNDIETLRNLRYKYASAERIREQINHDFTSYQEFLGFMDIPQQQLADTRKYLDIKLRDLLHARDEARRRRE